MAGRTGTLDRVVPAAELEAMVAEEVDRITGAPGAVVALLQGLITDVREAQGAPRGLTTRSWPRP